MQIFRTSLFWIMTLLLSAAFVYSSSPSQQDVDLIKLMQQNDVRLIVMRHGEALHNLNHLMNSSRSPGIYLTEWGIKQVQHSADQLLKETVDRIYVSPVYRTLQTAQIVAARLEIPYQRVLIEEGLREQFFGDFEDRPYEEYEAYFPDIEDVYLYAVPRGESGSELFSRTRNFLWKIASEHSGETILLVTHGYNCCQISKCLTGSYQDIPQKAEYRRYDFRRMNFDKGWKEANEGASF